MLKNHFMLAMRNLLRKRGYSLINLVGLSIGLACCLLVFQFVVFEYSFDRFHENQSSIFRIQQTYITKGEVPTDGHGYTAQALAPAIKAGIPEIKAITRLHSDEVILWDAAKPNNVFEDDGVLYADPDFFSIFSFPLVTGNITKALEPGTTIITESAAKKYFGNARPIGEVLHVTGIFEKDFIITAVMQDVPANSHIQFDVLLPMQDLLALSYYAEEPEGGWSYNNFATLVQITPGVSLKEVQRKMTDTYLEHRGEILAQSGYSGALNLQALTDIHLNADVLGPGNIVTGSYQTVYFFLIIGLITLIIALLNYINLATARALNRAREVGVRKAIGAKRGQLILQFFTESSVVIILATMLAIGLATALLPWVNTLAGTELTPETWLNPYFIVAIVITVVVSILLAGSYPAFVLSSFKPTSVLKGNGNVMLGQGLLRKCLVVFQFVACIFLIAGTLTVLKQINFMRSQDLGMNLDQVVTIRAPRVLAENVNRAVATETFIQRIKALPGVINAARSTTVPGAGFNWNGASIRKVEDDPSAAIRGVATYIDSAFASVYDLQLIAGSEYKDVTFTNEPESPLLVMVNETTIRSLGYESPKDAVEQLLNFGGYNAKIIGVYKDFNWTSAHEARQNIVFAYTSTGRHYSVRLATSDVAGVIDDINKIYQSQFPNNLFHYAFADDTFDTQYKNDKRFANLFSLAAGMAIFIACLGLLGLITFTAQQRTKEIGIRKVLGASETRIVALLSKDFLLLVIIGFVISMPITWLVMTQWLEKFAYRTEIGILTLLVAGFTAALIAFATVSWQSFKAATANPVNSLRSE